MSKILILCFMLAASARADEDLDPTLDALAMGMPARDAVTALDALGPKKDARALPVLLRYARHRDPIVRAHAIAALGPLDAQARAREALLVALGDQDRDVRAAAAGALAAAKDPAAVPRLLLLLGRHDEAAVNALATLANADVARRVAELGGDVPDPFVARCLGAMLMRPDLGPDAVYVDVVHALAHLPGRESLAGLDAFAKSTGHDAARKAARAEHSRLTGEAAP
jgi:HEAT repeat protein